MQDVARASILLPPDTENGAPSFATFHQRETVLRFQGENGHPWKFAFQFNPDTKKLSYNQHTLSKIYAAAIATDDGRNPYASLVFRAGDEVTNSLQGSTVCLSVMARTSETEAGIELPSAFHGTAFYVAPNLLQTARHNIKPVGPIPAARLEFRTRSNISDLNHLARGFNATPLEPADDSAIVPAGLCHMGSETGSEDRDPIDETPCETQNDFTFLTSSKIGAKILVPGVLRDVNSHILAVGYPGTPDHTEAIAAANKLVLAEHRRDPDMYARHLSQLVLTMTSLFRANVMNISPGSVVRSKHRMSAHDCTTFRGYSGGPIVPIDTAGVFFGQHVGGSTAVEPEPTANVYLANTHPVYVESYIKNVLPVLRDELAKNEQLLTAVQQDHLLCWLNLVLQKKASSLKEASDLALHQSA
ncbi:hypothetical protein HDU87_003460 [Geranomyces variabilis]|uniref:Uncharacterized protein n=1 Tax=Geranomyces variabilis TaxID=109894 RepID=A0AAD5TJS3_9FUNG|nr:hypothetical protein HDU87_003460 [Geranomyces variabilis]